jgi:hypothetical protein
MDAGLTQLEQQAQQQDEKTHQQPGQEHSFALLELPRDALVGILTAARDLDPYAKHNLKALACSCKHLNLLVGTDRSTGAACKSVSSQPPEAVLSSRCKKGGGRLPVWKKACLHPPPPAAAKGLVVALGSLS